MDFKANKAVSEESGRDTGGWTMVAKEAHNLVPTFMCDKSPDED